MEFLDVITAEPIPYDIFVLTVIGAMGWLPALALVGTVTMQLGRGLYWFLREYLSVVPIDRDKAVINGAIPFVLCLSCYGLAIGGGYAAHTPNLLFGAVQIAAIVGIGPYVGITVGKAAVNGVKSVVVRVKGGEGPDSEPKSEGAGA